MPEPLPQPRLFEKVAIVTGASRGIGAAIAATFTELGAQVVLTDIDGPAVEAVARDLGAPATAMRHDVRLESEWQEVVAQTLARHGKLDILVNNAGVFVAAPLLETSVEEFRRVMEVNELGVFLGCRTVVPPMREAGRGSIVNVSSLAGLRGSPLLTAYAASKWAVRGMTKVLARELAQDGIRVNSVHPGQIDTDMNARQREATPQLIERLIRAIPMQRIGTCAEVADAVAYLASNESGYVTGAELSVDGGAAS